MGILDIVTAQAEAVFCEVQLLSQDCYSRAQNPFPSPYTELPSLGILPEDKTEQAMSLH